MAPSDTVYNADSRQKHVRQLHLGSETENCITVSQKNFQVLLKTNTNQLLSEIFQDSFLSEKICLSGQTPWISDTITQLC